MNTIKDITENIKNNNEFIFEYSLVLIDPKHFIEPNYRIFIQQFSKDNNIFKGSKEVFKNMQRTEFKKTSFEYSFEFDVDEGNWFNIILFNSNGKLKDINSNIYNCNVSGRYKMLLNQKTKDMVEIKLSKIG